MGRAAINQSEDWPQLVQARSRSMPRVSEQHFPILGEDPWKIGPSAAIAEDMGERGVGGAIWNLPEKSLKLNVLSLEGWSFAGKGTLSGSWERLDRLSAICWSVPRGVPLAALTGQR